MSSIEIDHVNDLASTLFDRVASLASSRRSSGQPAYFAPAGEPGVTSYFEPLGPSATQPVDFEFPGGGTAEGLIEALAAYWSGRGEDDLAALAPDLAKLAEALRSEVVEGDGSVDILCYTMF